MVDERWQRIVGKASSAFQKIVQTAIDKKSMP